MVRHELTILEPAFLILVMGAGAPGKERDELLGCVSPMAGLGFGEGIGPTGIVVEVCIRWGVGAVELKGFKVLLKG